VDKSMASTGKGQLPTRGKGGDCWAPVSLWVDGVLHCCAGILDQGQGVLILFDDFTTDYTYTGSLETISSLGKVLDSLYSKAKQMH
jgi:hypothetical protein